MSEAPCLKVPKALGEKAIVLVRRLNLFDRELKVEHVEDYLYIPLVDKPHPQTVEELKKSLAEFEVSTHCFHKTTKRPRTLMDALEDKLPPHLLATLPRAIDFVGDIATVEASPELESHKRMVGEAILTTHKQVRTVLAKLGAIGGIYRLREFEVVAGVEKTETVHREHGCKYRVDLSKVYFSPRLSYEHDRISSQVREGETVIDMFAGVGPFSILIAKRHENVRVYAIDVNSDAIHYLKTNIVANRVQGKVMPILGDARRVIEDKLRGVADRVIMNLPERAMEYMDVACKAIRPDGGIMHYYEFVRAPNSLEATKTRLVEAVRQSNRNVKKILFARTVRETAPFTWQVVVDAEIQ